MNSIDKNPFWLIENIQAKKKGNSFAGELKSLS